MINWKNFAGILHVSQNFLRLVAAIVFTYRYYDCCFFLFSGEYLEIILGVFQSEMIIFKVAFGPANQMVTLVL